MKLIRFISTLILFSGVACSSHQVIQSSKKVVSFSELAEIDFSKNTCLTIKEQYGEPRYVQKAYFKELGDVQLYAYGLPGKQSSFAEFSFRGSKCELIAVIWSPSATDPLHELQFSLDQFKPHVFVSTHRKQTLPDFLPYQVDYINNEISVRIVFNEMTHAVDSIARYSPQTNSTHIAQKRQPSSKKQKK